MDAYCEKIKRDSQHQLEEVFDWAAHLKHLLAVLQEFDPAPTPNEEIMICYFQEGLKLSVRAKLDARGRDLNSWEEAVKKAVNAEAKAMLQSSLSTCDIDSKCFQGKQKKDKKDSVRKNKSTDSVPADTFSGKQSFSTQQTFFANPKKDQDHQQGFRRRRR